MNLYSFLSIGYDLLDKIWFSDRGINPRDAIKELLPNEKCKVLDMCCGTFSNGLPIAKKNPKSRVVGLDRSKEMLREARGKVRAEGLENVTLACRDATQTGFREESFDYIILGLVLHECNAELWEGILAEVRRLLKPDGKLIVLEWNKQTKTSRKIKFALLYGMEMLTNPGYFRYFYNSDKEAFFERYGFRTIENRECNYTSVLSMCKE